MSRWGDSEEERARNLEREAMRNYREAFTPSGGGGRTKGCLVVPLALLTLIVVLRMLGEVVLPL